MTVRICWVTVAGKLCCGRIAWTRVGDDWHGECSRCHASGLAAVGERAELEREEKERASVNHDLTGGQS